MARKAKHEEHENHERWLVSYADFITLLFAFFVVMYAISSVNEGKFRVLSESLVAAFRANPRSINPINVGNPTTAFSLESPSQPRPAASPQELVPSIAPPIKHALSMPHDAPEDSSESGRSGEHKVLDEISDRVAQAFKPLIDRKLITVKRTRFSLEVEIRAHLLFGSGSAALGPEAVLVLEDVARILKDYPNELRVGGYTDDVPISTAIYPSNWELSAARAASVVHLFMEKGVNPGRMAAVGYGEYRPTGDNRTAVGRAQNRKVVIVILGSKPDSEMAVIDSFEERLQPGANAGPSRSVAAPAGKQADAVTPPDSTSGTKTESAP